LKHLWLTDVGLTALTIFLFIDVFVVSPLIATPIGTALSDVLSILILVSGVWTVFNSRKVRILLALLALLSIVVHWWDHFVDNPVLASLDLLLNFLFAGLLSGMVLIQVFREGPITMHRVMGAVTVYLLIGFMWAMLYELVALQLPGAFQLSLSPAVSDLNQVEDHFIYFSFVTLTTLGFGDIVAVHPIARNLVLLEALLGQLFPVVLLSRLVALEVTHSKRHKSHSQ
jgi:hypothetical protein